MCASFAYSMEKQDNLSINFYVAQTAFNALNSTHSQPVCLAGMDMYATTREQLMALAWKSLVGWTHEELGKPAEGGSLLAMSKPALQRKKGYILKV